MGPCIPSAVPQGPIIFFILLFTGTSDPITPTVTSSPSMPKQPRCTPKATHPISHLCLPGLLGITSSSSFFFP